MTAADAVQKRTDIVKLRTELRKLSELMEAYPDFKKTATKECGVYDITARLDYAQRVLAEYDGILERSLQSTELGGVLK